MTKPPAGCKAEVVAAAVAAAAGAAAALADGVVGKDAARPAATRAWVAVAEASVQVGGRRHAGRGPRRTGLSSAGRHHRAGPRRA